MRARIPLVLSCLLPTIPCAAAIYTFESLPEQKLGKVTVHLEKGTATEFWIPAWSPGDYQIFDYGKNAQEIVFTKAGAVVEPQHPGANQWTVPAGADTVTYKVGRSVGNFSYNIFFSGSETFVSPSGGILGWFSGHMNEAQTLIVKKTPGAKVYNPLDPVSEKSTESTFAAADYDKLIDSPFVISSTARVASFEVGGKPHSIVGFGTPSGGDVKGWAQVAGKVVEQAYQLFGELPYSRYMFFLNFAGGVGGLEHLNSTSIGIGNLTPTQAPSFLAHEYFHCFNVKRIRPKPLGPFDYTKPAVTGTIWWLEGVTDYYADVLLARAGITSREQLLRSLGREIAQFQRNPNRLKVSALDASLKVWEAGGSYGYGGVSYYQKGKLIGFVLDLAIREGSKTKFSLDDVIRELYKETKNSQPGFPEGRIRELCVQYGGQSLGPIYDDCVTAAVELPTEKVFPEAGFVWKDGALVDAPSSTRAQDVIGRVWPGTQAQWADNDLWLNGVR